MKSFMKFNSCEVDISAKPVDASTIQEPDQRRALLRSRPPTDEHNQTRMRYLAGKTQKVIAVAGD